MEGNSIEIQMERGMARQDGLGVQLSAQMEEMRRILEGVERGEEQAKRNLLANSFAKVGIPLNQHHCPISHFQVHPTGTPPAQSHQPFADPFRGPFSLPSANPNPISPV